MGRTDKVKKAARVEPARRLEKALAAEAERAGTNKWDLSQPAMMTSVRKRRQ